MSRTASLRSGSVAARVGRCAAGFHPSFSRHDKVQTSLTLFIWLNENVRGDVGQHVKCKGKDNF